MKNRFSRSFVTFVALIAMLAVAGLSPFTAFAADGETVDWQVSKSKTATNLDENYESQITLSLPSSEEQLVSDVVFVADGSSCDSQVIESVQTMLQGLSDSVSQSGAKINIGLVKFRGGIPKGGTYGLAALNTESINDLTTLLGTSFSSNSKGSNLEAGLLAGEQMLDSDTSVDASRKYMIVVSDGMTYLWNGTDGSPEGINWSQGAGEGGVVQWPNNSLLELAKGSINWAGSWTTTEWADYLNAMTQEKVDSTIAEFASPYTRFTDLSPNPPDGSKFETAEDLKTDYNSVDIALYKAKQAYQTIADKYNIYAVDANEDSTAQMYGPSFMRYLSSAYGSGDVDFNKIQNDINYLLDEGSTVTDYMGYTSGDDGYNFDFVNDASQLWVKVGDWSYPAEKISDNKYGFNLIDNDHYEYILEYIPGNMTDEEHFVWTINTKVSNFETTQLIYSVKLTNPQTTPGTYGQYDADGSQRFDGLYTNNEARLDWVTTDRNEGTDYFAKPTVSYTIAPAEEPTEEPTQDTTGTTQASASPTTGVESNHTITWVLVIAGAAAVVLAAAVMNKRRSRG